MDIFGKINHIFVLLKELSMFERNKVIREELSKVAGELIAEFPERRIFAFYGKMGAGKTTFIREICKVLGSSDVVNSPSFAIINEYHTREGNPLFHFDFYRLKTLTEAFDLGYEDYFFSGHYCLIEWPEKIESLLPEGHVAVKLTEDQNGSRTIKAGLPD